MDVMEQPDHDLRPPSLSAGEAMADLRNRLADEREQIADLRDHIADERERVADERDEIADARQAAADQRDTELSALADHIAEQANLQGLASDALVQASLTQIAAARDTLDRSRAQLSRVEATIGAQFHHALRKQADVDRETARTIRQGD